MKLTVDRIEDKFVVCESESGDIINIELDKIGFNVCDGMILSYEDNVYKILQEDEEQKRDNLRSRLEKIKE